MSTKLRNPNKPEKKLKLFTERSEEEIEASIRDERITSPVHWRYYFDQNPVTWEIQTKLYDFICMAPNNPTEAANWLKSIDANSGKKEFFRCWDFLDRLGTELGKKSLKHDVKLSVFRILSDVADELSTQAGPSFPLDFDTFMLVEELSIKILKAFDVAERERLILAAIESSLAFSWIMYFVRSLMRYHGAIDVGDRVRLNWFGESEIAKLGETALERIKFDADKILQTSNPRHILYLWYDLGDENERRNLMSWIEDQTSTELGLIRFVGAFSSIRVSRQGYEWYIQTKFLKKILNLEEAERRLQEVSVKDTKQRGNATELLRRLHATTER